MTSKFILDLFCFHSKGRNPELYSDWLGRLLANIISKCCAPLCLAVT